MEYWKSIIGYENKYLISSKGRVKSLKTNKLLKQSLDRSYFYVCLSKNGIVKNFRIHRLVALHFIINDQNLPIVNHINGIKKDNRVENLEWCTDKYNRKHAVINGLMSRGESHYHSKLKDKDIPKIRQLFKNGLNQVKIGKMYGIHNSTVGDIIKQKQWKHIK